MHRRTLTAADFGLRDHRLRRPWPRTVTPLCYTNLIPYDQLLMVTLQLRQLMVYPGQRIQLRDVKWPMGTELDRLTLYPCPID